MNIILLARDKQALEAVANSIHSKYPSVKTRIIVSDLSGDAPTVAQNVFQQVKDLDISTLIINAGFAVPEVSILFYSVSLSSAFIHLFFSVRFGLMCLILMSFKLMLLVSCTYSS